MGNSRLQRWIVAVFMVRYRAAKNKPALERVNHFGNPRPAHRARIMKPVIPSTVAQLPFCEVAAFQAPLRKWKGGKIEQRVLRSPLRHEHMARP